MDREQGLLAEAIVMTLQHEDAGVVAHEPFFEMVEEACRGLGIAPPTALTPEAVAAMRKRFAQLRSRWEDLPPGGTLELDFPAGER